MADRSLIEWTNATWNPTRGCSRCSPGCDNCYAMGQAHRHNWERRADDGRVQRGAYHGLTTLRKDKVDWTGSLRPAYELLAKPLRWKKPRKIFVNSMSDLFHPSLDMHYVAAVFAVMAACPQHVFQVLTKRPDHAAKWFDWMRDESRLRGLPASLLWSMEQLGVSLLVREQVWTRGLNTADWPLPNAWMGVSVESQRYANERIGALLSRVPAAVRYISAEPLLSGIDLVPFLPRHPGGNRPFAGGGAEREADGLRGLDWVIVGGESGAGARPYDLSWPRALIAQCQASGVPLFHKQVGARPYISGPGLLDDDDPDAVDICPLRPRHPKGGDPHEWPEDLRVREWPRQLLVAA